MKILVFSDSHGKTEDMILTIERIQPNIVFHLGDYLSDAEEVTYAFPQLPLYCVFGNCDYDIDGQHAEQKLSFDGVTFLICHGHLFDVKRGCYAAITHATAEKADVLLFGHTHIPCMEQHGSVQVINPGSIRYNHTYAEITIEQGVARCALQTV